MPEYGIIAFFSILGAIFVGGGMITSALISYRSPENKDKREPYECGEPVIGTARIQFKMGFYLFALMFLVFDIESLFLFPCVRIFREVANGEIVGLNTLAVFIELFVFVFILSVGLVYAWRKGILKWE